MSVVFTFPGRMGDAILQWPVAFWWHKKHQKPFTVWMDKNTCKPLVKLFKYQDGVEAVELREGIQNYSCGGQPFHFNLSTDDFKGHQVHHLGMRSFPNRQITLEAFAATHLGLDVDPEDLADTPVFKVPRKKKANRVVLHGTTMTYASTTPNFWKFLHRVMPELKARFDEIVFVGTERERGMALLAYPDAVAFKDNGDFLKLASYINASELVLAAGSSVATVAASLCVPCVRVHDPIGEHHKSIWSNLGKNQLNATELELRTEWGPFFEAWFGVTVDG